MGFLAGKRALIVGVATDRSIAWGIAQAMHREGAELAFSYVNDQMKERVEPLADSLGSNSRCRWMSPRTADRLGLRRSSSVNGASSISSSTPWPMHLAKPSPAASSDNTSREAFRIAHEFELQFHRARTRRPGP